MLLTMLCEIERSALFKDEQTSDVRRR